MRINKLLLLIACPPLIIVGCSLSKNARQLNNSDRLAFIEYNQTTEGVSLKGIAPEGRRIGQPTYNFNNSDTTISLSKNLGNLSQNANYVALLGIKKFLNGIAGQGVSSILYGVEKIPFESDGIKIIKLESNAVTIIFKGKKIKLSEDEAWENLTSQIDTINCNEPIIVETRKIQSIKFHGFIHRRNFHLNYQTK